MFNLSCVSAEAEYALGAIAWGILAIIIIIIVVVAIKSERYKYNLGYRRKFFIDEIKREVDSRSSELLAMRRTKQIDTSEKQIKIIQNIKDDLITYLENLKAQDPEEFNKLADDLQSIQPNFAEWTALELCKRILDAIASGKYHSEKGVLSSDGELLFDFYHICCKTTLIFKTISSPLFKKDEDKKFAERMQTLEQLILATAPAKNETTFSETTRKES